MNIINSFIFLKQILLRRFSLSHSQEPQGLPWNAFCVTSITHNVLHTISLDMPYKLTKVFHASSKIHQAYNLLQSVLPVYCWRQILPVIVACTYFHFCLVCTTRTFSVQPVYLQAFRIGNDNADLFVSLCSLCVCVRVCVCAEIQVPQSCLLTTDAFSATDTCVSGSRSFSRNLSERDNSKCSTNVLCQMHAVEALISPSVYVVFQHANLL